MYRVGSGGRKRGYGCNKLLLEGRPLLSTPPQSGAAEWMCNKLILSRQGSLRQVDVMCSLQLALRTTAPCNKANNNAASCTHPWPCLPHASLHPPMSYLSSCSLLHYHDMISIPLLDVLYDLTLANQCCKGHSTWLCTCWEFGAPVIPGDHHHDPECKFDTVSWGSGRNELPFFFGWGSLELRGNNYYYFIGGAWRWCMCPNCAAGLAQQTHWRSWSGISFRFSHDSHLLFSVVARLGSQV